MKYNILGERLRELRDEKKLSRPKLARMINVTDWKITNIEYNNYKEGVEEEIVYALCKELNCSKEYLCGETNVKGVYQGDYLNNKLYEELQQNLSKFVRKCSHVDKLQLNTLMQVLMEAKRVEYKKLSNLTHQIIIQTK